MHIHAVPHSTLQLVMEINVLMSAIHHFHMYESNQLPSIHPLVYMYMYK